MDEKIWCVCRFSGGKFFDGYYGADAIIQEGGIFSLENRPYKLAPGYTLIIVGIGATKPALPDVRDILADICTLPDDLIRKSGVLAIIKENERLRDRIRELETEGMEEAGDE